MFVAGPSDLEQVLTTIIGGAVEVTDPVSQKLCFFILKKLVEVWGTSAVLLCSRYVASHPRLAARLSGQSLVGGLSLTCA